jgi:hypothetical protein
MRHGWQPHDAGASAGGNHIVTPSVLGGECAASLRDNAAELACHSIVARQSLQRSASCCSVVLRAAFAALSTCSGEGIRAPPNTMIVDRIPQSRSASSAVAYSSANRMASSHPEQEPGVLEGKPIAERLRLRASSMSAPEWVWHRQFSALLHCRRHARIDRDQR